jgi:hypothetical protein
VASRLAGSARRAATGSGGPQVIPSKRRTHLVASRSMSERYGIDVIRSWTSEVGLNGPGSTTAADCLRGAIYVCDSFDLSLEKGVSIRKGKSVGVRRLCLVVRIDRGAEGWMETEDAGGWLAPKRSCRLR